MSQPDAVPPTKPDEPVVHQHAFDSYEKVTCIGCGSKVNLYDILRQAQQQVDGIRSQNKELVHELHVREGLIGHWQRLEADLNGLIDNMIAERGRLLAELEAVKNERDQLQQIIDMPIY